MDKKDNTITFNAGRDDVPPAKGRYNIRSQQSSSHAAEPRSDFLPGPRAPHPEDLRNEDANAHSSDSSSSEPSVVELERNSMNEQLWQQRIQEIWNQHSDLVAPQRGRGGRWRRGRGLVRGGRGRQAQSSREEPMPAVTPPPLETRADIQEIRQQHSDLFASRLPHAGRWIGRVRGSNRSSGRGSGRGIQRGYPEQSESTESLPPA